MIPVRDLYSSCEMMLRDKWGYIWGTAGEMWSAEKQAKYKAKYEGDSKREMSCKYGGKWAGHMVSDCAGVMVYIWRQHGMSIYHGSNTIKRKYCGTTQTKPQPGYAAFRVKNGTDYHHIGIVAEDGLNVYEDKGTQAGFVMSAASSWNCFAPFLDVDYEGGDLVEPFEQYPAIVDTQKDPLNVREEPNKNSRILFKLQKGAEIWVVKDMGNGWARIDDDGVQGYASLKYLKKATETPVSAPEGPDNKTPTPPQEPAKNAILCGVWIPCDNEAEALRYAGDIKGAIIIRADKPPDAKGE